MSRQNIIIAVFVLEALPLPIVAMGWVFALCAPDLLVRPSFETVVLWGFLLYPVIWLWAFRVALKYVHDPQNRLPAKLAALPAFVLLLYATMILAAGL
jgi:hypothetical protein